MQRRKGVMKSMEIRRIIHISDMHFSEHEERKSLLQKEKYVEDWIDSLKKIEELDTLIISGDIVDRGGSERIYKNVSKLIKKIKSELGIKHILCVPGNHDVSRDLLNGIKGKDDVDPNNLWKYYDVKLQYYWDFMKENEMRCFQTSGVVSYEILENPNMVLLGIDSTEYIGISDGYGYINIEKMKEALQSIFGKKGEKYKNYIKIAVLHHRPIIYESGSQTVTENNSCGVGQYGTCDSENWEKASKILLSYDVHYVLTGHVHGSQSGQIRSFSDKHDEINYSTVGSIGVDFSEELRDRLNQNEDKDLIEKLQELKCYGSLNGNHNAYNIWTFTDRGLVREEQYKYIIDEGKRRWCHWETKDFEEEKIDFTEEKEDSQVSVFDGKVVSPKAEDEKCEDYEEKILEVVRDHGLYKTGHYHWKNSARLNWIDTSYFFQHREVMYYIAKGVNELFEREESLKKADCIIGLGIKGSILLSYIRFLFPEKKCSYLPENKKEYNRYEMTLFAENEKLNNIAVLTDVVHTGNTIKKFAEELLNREKNFLNIHVVTIFDATPDGKVAGIKGKAKFNLHSLANLKVTDCQGGGENCSINIKKLATVIEYKEG